MSKEHVKRAYRIYGAYDSETTNIKVNGHYSAFPILHQVGILKSPIEDVSANNIEENTEIHLFRHSLDLFEFLDMIAETEFGFVPVILCHNLAFDMYALSPWLSSRNVRVLAKSARKPITFTVMDDSGNARLVIWDTLVFTQTSLERMGKDCGYFKGVGEWDYDLIRTPETPLTDEETDYAKRDIYTLLSYMAWWIRRNPQISPEKLGLNVVTKTGVVREIRRIRFDQMKGKGHKRNVGRYWLYQNREQAPKTDDELFTMQAATRGGFTFVASGNASRVFDFRESGYCIAGFDATSQHPAQMSCHYYPVNFKEHSARLLRMQFDLIGLYSLDEVLSHYDKPFPCAFYGCFEFVNLHPKDGTLFEEFGIYPLASARYRKMDEDNGDRIAHDENRESLGYCDSAVNAEVEFGKLKSAGRCTLYLTELAAWEMWQCYEWDSVEALHGYSTGRFVRPTDMSLVSVMEFFKAKNEFKKAREEYRNSGCIANGEKLVELGFAPAIVASMEDGTLSESDLDNTYQQSKANLNALYGIEVCNEYRRDTVLSNVGITYSGDFGICNAPKNSKVWYQFGQRIVGWSRIAQIIVMVLARPYVETIVNGDTDSVKFVCKRENVSSVEKALQRYSNALDRAKERTCLRVKLSYPDCFDSLDGIGHYELEFISECFCASWNKAYTTFDIDKRDMKRHFHFTIAGLPTRKREGLPLSVDELADELHGKGMGFEDICDAFLGYNVTYAHDVIKLNSRSFPEWGEVFNENVTDYLGRSCKVVEPCALALYPMAKTTNDTRNDENRANMRIAQHNRPEVNTSGLMICSKGIIETEDFNVL